ncbi:serine/threonine-protein kinase MHK isoform X1 [Malania oleifera]|uniref:serine/threonine-protein kinase MHK isoform X1 n=1 Tax=Malania oleifera TaxID=397392 RepID=UPI0025AE0E0B|nr:serine/threonine-protein kinase MHK isoform X1 [Malania oleifera]XP_057965209.1 serine/threonine-protein kinase MHK isoform X1 [Malania oleifera]
MMERYKILKELGDGTCGRVYKAVNMETYEIVAVKKMKRKFYFWEDCMSLRELKALRKLKHPNIIMLKEVVRENNELFFIFEYMEYNLYQIMKERRRHFSEEEIRRFMSQVLQGLAHMHKNGYFHRDLKPENLLVTNDVIKIADFGLAREVSLTPPYTDYVSTRWYRAPEVLLQSSMYTPAIDMWAVGAILAELFTLFPIFPGESEIDQFYKICCVRGTPDWRAFPQAMNVSQLVNITYSEILPANLSDIIPNASLEAIDLIMKLCSWDPLRRPTAEQSLQHPFFHVGTWVPYPLRDPLQLKPNATRVEPNLELNLWNFDPKTDDCFLGLTLAVKPSISNLEMVRKVSEGTREDMLFCSGFQGHLGQSAFWSLLSPDRNETDMPLRLALSLPFSSIQHPSVGVPQSAGFTVTSLQPNMLDHSY